MQGKEKIGKISRLHGFKGELSLKIDPEYASWLSELEHVFLEMDKKLVPHFIDSLRFTPQGYALVFFDGISDQRSAESLRGSAIWIDQTQLPEAFWSARREDDLRGYMVIDESLGEIGEVSEVVEHPGNSFLLIAQERGEVLIPLTEHIVKDIDHDSEQIRVSTPEGLVELNLD